MNTTASYTIGDAVQLIETGMTPKYPGAERKARRSVRHGVVVKIDNRIRVKWGITELFHDGVLVYTSPVDGKRTWIAPNRLKIVTQA